MRFPALNSRAVWLIAGVGLLLTAQATTFFFVPQSFALTFTTDTIEFFLILSAFLAFLMCCFRSDAQDRPFWILLTVYWGTRIVVQLMWAYFNVILRREAPNPFIGDVLLFLSNILVFAALLLRPHVRAGERVSRLGAIDFFLLLLWCLYLYVFFVAPWQYLTFNEMAYGTNYNRLEFILDLGQLGLLAFLWARTSGQWRLFWSAFFAAQSIKTFATYAANRGIDTHVYYPGSWLDLPFGLGLALFTLVGLIGMSVASHPPKTQDLKGRFHGEWFGMAVVLSLPLFAGWNALDRKIPLLVVQARELVTLSTIVVMTSLVFVKLRRVQQELRSANSVFREASLTDHLTGLRNRRFFDTTISAEVRQAHRSPANGDSGFTRDLIVYLVDLDEFKQVNDQHGHEAGDKVLMEAARRLTNAVRSSDMVLRWGGDEFMIVSRYTPANEAGTLAARILDIMSSAPIDIPCLGIQVRQTCSVGWAIFPWSQDHPQTISLEAVLEMADRGLYQAKISGRNQAVNLDRLVC